MCCEEITCNILADMFRYNYKFDIRKLYDVHEATVGEAGCGADAC
jgi:hypothetical protein